MVRHRGLDAPYPRRPYRDGLDAERRTAMTVAPATTIEPDTVSSFEINPGTLPQFLETRPEGGPRLKCFEGSVTLVSPGMPHETAGARLDLLVLAVCQELGIEREALRSTTWTLPFGAG